MNIIKIENKMECKALRFYITKEGGDYIHMYIYIYIYQLSFNEFYKEYFKLESYVNVFICFYFVRSAIAYGDNLYLLFYYFKLKRFHLIIEKRRRRYEIISRLVIHEELTADTVAAYRKKKWNWIFN